MSLKEKRDNSETRKQQTRAYGLDHNKQTKPSTA